MDDRAIRKLVQDGLTNGRLPRETGLMAQRLKPGEPVPTGILGGSSLPDPCAVCSAKGTQLRFNRPAGALAFHQRCYEIWKEETEKPQRRHEVMTGVGRSLPPPWLQLQDQPPEVAMLHRWLDSWTGAGAVIDGMVRQGFDVALTRNGDAGWGRCSFLRASSTTCRAPARRGARRPGPRSMRRLGRR